MYVTRYEKSILDTRCVDQLGLGLTSQFYVACLEYLPFATCYTHNFFYLLLKIFTLPLLVENNLYNCIHLLRESTLMRSVIVTQSIFICT